MPTVSFSVTLDTDADSGIGYEGRMLTVGTKTYTLSANGGTLQPVTTSGTIDYSITVTDSYGQTGTLSGTISVLAYTPPALTGVAISRYVASLNTQGQTIYELDDDGDKLWFDSVIAVQTTLGSGTNTWSLIITPVGGSAISVLSGSSLSAKTYAHDRTVLTGTYANTSTFTFSVELSDAFTTVTYFRLGLEASFDIGFRSPKDGVDMEELDVLRPSIHGIQESTLDHMIRLARIKQPLQESFQLS